MEAKQLAKAFSATLHEWLGAETMAEVVRLNAAEPDSRICHSHDFCDANQAMLDAMGEDVVFDAGNQPLLDLINSAWELAAAEGFAL